MCSPEGRFPKLAYSRRLPAIEEHHKRRIADVLRGARRPLEDTTDTNEVSCSLFTPVQVPKPLFIGPDGREMEVLNEEETETSGKSEKNGRAGRSMCREGHGAANASSASAASCSQAAGRQAGGTANAATPLLFSSSFECGNLLSAKLVQVSTPSPEAPGPLLEYELEMESDTQASGRTQWFYFSVLNTIPCSAIIRIVNFRKTKSLYRCGMQPHVFSKQTAAQTGSPEWDATACSDVTYTQNCRRTSSGRPLFTLTFRYDFRYAQDTVYFACHTPYTFGMLRDFLVKLSQDSRTSAHVSIRTLCRSAAGVPVPVLLVTSGLPLPGIAYNPVVRERMLAEVRRKPAIVLIARQHPGEVVGSWVMAGFIRFIVGGSQEAVALRDRFCFHIIPMVNVDGVIYGNSRCTLAGADPNRCWAAPNPTFHPVIFALREYIVTVQKKACVELFIDIHGHSQRTSAFFYGCCPEEMRSALFPKLASLATNDIDFDESRWRFGKAHNQTARAVAHNECGIQFSYTLETSFFAQRVPCAVEECEDLASTQARVLQEVLFLPARSESIGFAVGRAMLHFFRAEASIKGYLSMPPVMTELPDDDSDDLCTRAGRETFEKADDCSLPWMTLQRLRLVHADFLLAELEASGPSVFDLAAGREGDDVPASDSDCDEDTGATTGRDDSGSTPAAGTTEASANNSGQRDSQRHCLVKSTGKRRSASGSVVSVCRLSKNRQGAVSKNPGAAASPGDIDDQGTRCNDEAGECAASREPLTTSHCDARDGDAVRDATGTRSPPNSHSNSKTTADSTFDSQLLSPQCRSLPSAASASTLEIHSTASMRVCPMWAQALQRSRILQTETSTAAAGSQSDCSKTPVRPPHSRPATRRARISEWPAMTGALSLVASTRMIPLGGASFPAYVAMDEQGQMTYLSSPTNTPHDGAGLLPRLHISRLPAPSLPSSRSVPGCSNTLSMESLDGISSSSAKSAHASRQSLRNPPRSFAAESASPKHQGGGSCKLKAAAATPTGRLGQMLARR